MTIKVLVYGSLLKGLHNHRLLEDTVYLGEHTTDPEFTMFSLGGFPGVIRHGKTAIKGEVYEVDDKTFKSLDSLEGYPSFYSREEVDTPYGKAWIYLLQHTHNFNQGEVTNGDWRSYYEAAA